MLLEIYEKLFVSFLTFVKYTYTGVLQAEKSVRLRSGNG